eukprot:259228_1
MTRFYPKDISNLLPHLFTEQYNNQTFKYTTKSKQIMEKLEVIRDLRFESFYLAVSNISYPVMQTKSDNISDDPIQISTGQTRGIEKESVSNVLINEEEKLIQLPQVQTSKIHSTHEIPLVVVVGNYGVGKSSFVKAVIGDSTIPQTRKAKKTRNNKNKNN